MIQLRLKEGSASDRRWFNPDRDMVNIWPRLLRKTLMSFADFEGMEGCTQEQMQAHAGKLGALVAKAIREPVDHEQAGKDIKAWMEENPAISTEIARRAFAVLHGCYVAWLADAKPKTECDSDIPVVGLDQIAGWLAANAKA